MPARRRAGVKTWLTKLWGFHGRRGFLGLGKTQGDRKNESNDLRMANAPALKGTGGLCLP